MKGLNTMHGDRNVRQFRISQGVISSLKCFIAVWALSGDSLSLILTGYRTDVPILKYFFTFLAMLDGWGIENIFYALGYCISCKCFFTLYNADNGYAANECSVVLCSRA